VSNPYRTSSPDLVTPANAVWTTTTYDALSRVLTVSTPDNATVTTQYGGNMVMVTDQAQKKRITEMDALGRLTNVWEVMSTSSGIPDTTSVIFKYKDASGVNVSST
jgi:hypothetical protein